MTVVFIFGFVIAIGVVGMLVLKKVAKTKDGVVEDTMREYALKEIPSLENSVFKVVCLLEDAINAQHFWVVAYNGEGMHLLPTKANPFNGTLHRYVDETPTFNWKKQLAANLFVGNKSEELEYLPYKLIDNVSVDKNKKKILITIGSVTNKFKYQEKDCCGAMQEETMGAFLAYLEKI